MQSVKKLTFGVELEFIVRLEDSDPYIAATILSDFDESHNIRLSSLSTSELFSPDLLPLTTSQVVQVEMAQVLRNAGIPCNKVGSDLENFSKWTVMYDGSITPRRGQPPNYLGFKEVEVGIELKTRKLPFCEESLEEVGHVLKTLNEKFRIRTNDTTGLHVHIGKKKKKRKKRALNDADQHQGEVEEEEYPFTLTTLKNLVALFMIFESEIQILHPASRIDNYYCLTPRACFPPDTSLTNILAQIDNTSTSNELVALMGGGYNSSEDLARQFAYNFQQLDLGAGGFGTVEFRQHEGTVDFRHVSAWVQFVAGLVSWAGRGAQVNGLEGLAERGRKLGFERFMRFEGMEGVARVYEMMLRGRRALNGCDGGGEDVCPDGRDSGEESDDTYIAWYKGGWIARCIGWM